MKTTAFALLAALMPLGFRPQETPPQETPPDRDRARQDALSAFYQGEGARLTQEVEGAWMLMDYVDPQEREIASQVDGFALFHDGFLSWQVAVRTYDTRLFHVAEVLLLQTGAYRYRFEHSNLQMSAILGYSSFTDDNALEREPSGEAYEYLVTLDDGVMDLRTDDGVVLTFRRVDPGEFPEDAIRTIEGRRSGQPHWEPVTGEPR